MIELPKDPYVEFRDGGHLIVGTRISIASIACGMRRGETIEEISKDFPALESREKLEGAIAFIRAHPQEIETYLDEKAKLWDKMRKQNPPELVERARKYRMEKSLESA